MTNIQRLREMAAAERRLAGLHGDCTLRVLAGTFKSLDLEIDSREAMSGRAATDAWHHSLNARAIDDVADYLESKYLLIGL